MSNLKKELNDLNDAISLFCADHECEKCVLGYSASDCIVMMAWRKLDRARLVVHKKRNVAVSPTAGQTVGSAPVKYSIEELEKISNALWAEFRERHICEPTSKAFIYRLKDKKRVEAILNG